jgi:hypothetical protein
MSILGPQTRRRPRLPWSLLVPFADDEMGQEGSRAGQRLRNLFCPCFETERSPAASPQPSPGQLQTNGVWVEHRHPTVSEHSLELSRGDTDSAAR